MTPSLKAWTCALLAMGLIGAGAASAAKRSAGLTLDPSPWTAEHGGFHFVDEIDASRADDVWAVGSHVAHFDGRSWRALDGGSGDGPGESWTGVDVLADGTGWIVGDDGSSMTVADGRITSVSHDPELRFHDVAIAAPGAVWAIARRETGSAEVLRRVGPTWETVWNQGRLYAGIDALSMTSPTDGWAVGSTAVHFDGSTWTEWPLPDGRRVHQVAGSQPDDVWAVGGDGPTFGLRVDRRWILHFDGKGWTVVMDEEGSPFHTLTVSDGIGYALTHLGEVYLLRDGTWKPIEAKVPSKDYRPWVSDATFVPGTKTALVSVNWGWMYRLEGEELSLVRDARVIDAVALLDSGNGWALGDRSLALEDGQWRPLDDEAPLGRANDVAAHGDSAWAVGDDGMVLHYAEDGWETVEAPAFDYARVAIGVDGTVWAAGEVRSEAKSSIVVRDTAGGWNTAWTGDGSLLDFAVADREAMVSTTAGVWSFDGREWVQVASEVAASVGIGHDGERWIGVPGAIRHLDTDGWSDAVYLLAEAQVHAFHTTASATWAVADHGFVLARTGGRWRFVRGARSLSGWVGQHYGVHDLTSLTLPNGTTELVAVGEPETVLRANEAHVLAHDHAQPDPTSEPDFPPRPRLDPQAYFPAALARPAFQDTGCHGRSQVSASAVEQRARDTAAYYAVNGYPPRRDVVGLMTATALAARHGVDLVGTEIRGQRIDASSCMWWATFSGWFDPRASAPDPTWTQLQLVISATDNTVMYEGFAGKRSVGPPTPTGVPTAPIHP